MINPLSTSALFPADPPRQTQTRTIYYDTTFFCTITDNYLDTISARFIHHTHSFTVFNVDTRSFFCGLGQSNRSWTSMLPIALMY